MHSMTKLPTKPFTWLANGILAVLSALKLNTPDKIMLALAPFYTALSGTVVAAAAKYLPVVGTHLTKVEVVSIFGAGVVFAATHVLVWLHSFQQTTVAQTNANVAYHYLGQTPPLVPVAPV